MAVVDRLAGARRRLKRQVARVAQIRVRAGDSGPTTSSATARVSVVVPVFNAMPYLRELLDSLVAQDLDPALFEVIAVDDGSTDGGGRLLDDYSARYGNWRIIHQRNSGWPGHPRNVGIDAGAGAYVFFCDADDRLGPEALRRMVAFADEHEVDVLAPRMVGVGGRRIQSSLFTGTVVDVDTRTILATLSPQKLIRRELLDSHGIRFPEGRIRLEDGMMLTRCYLASRRTAILADYDYYFIRRRDDGTNISSERAEPESYTRSVAEIARIITDSATDPGLAELMVLDLHRRKVLRFYAPARYRAMSAATRRRWLRAHSDFMERFVPERLETELEFPFRQRSELIRAGDADGLLALAATEEALTPNHHVLRPRVDEETVTFDLQLDSTAEYEAIHILARARHTDAALTFPVRRTGGAHTVVLPRSELEDLGRVLVDLFVRLRTDGVEGPPRRLNAPVEGLPADSPGIRLYATVRGNLSLDLRG